jgi:hypothetical protein
VIRQYGVATGSTGQALRARSYVAPNLAERQGSGDAVRLYLTCIALVIAAALPFSCSLFESLREASTWLRATEKADAEQGMSTLSTFSAARNGQLLGSPRVAACCHSPPPAGRFCGQPLEGVSQRRRAVQEEGGRGQLGGSTLDAQALLHLPG